MKAHFLKGTEKEKRCISLAAVDLSDDSEDLSKIQGWLNDPDVTYFMMYGQLPTNKDQARAIISEQVNSSRNVVFMVRVDNGESPAEIVGFAGLYDISLTARRAEFRIMIGEKSYWGKGLGTEVTEMLTFYGFDRLNLNRIFLGVVSDNAGAVKAYKKAGYVEEGVLRQDVYRNSRYYDDVRMAILREDYYAKLYAAHKDRFDPKKDA